MIDLPTVQFARSNGLEMAFYEVGPRQGIPVVFCHGFPELAFSWRHQLAALREKGRWAIAPDQRGYGLTNGPAEVEQYDMEHLTADLIGLLDALGIEKAIWCGHDWGGIVVWQMPLRYPERTAGVVGVNTPFLPRGEVDPIAQFRARFGDDMYIVRFQEPARAEQILGRDVERSLRFFMRRPSRNAIAQFSKSEGKPRHNFALLKALESYDPNADEREEFLSEDELAMFVACFERTGFRGGINWYRNFTRNWQRSAHVKQHVPHPALMIMAELDAVLPPALAEGMEAYVPDLEKVLVRDSGHWTQQERPAAVNEALLSWLDRRFPRG